MPQYTSSRYARKLDRADADMTAIMSMVSRFLGGRFGDVAELRAHISDLIADGHEDIARMTRDDCRLRD
jgi:hypothetical protein